MGFSFLTTSANMLDSISMSDINGASATASRAGSWERGWDSVTAPPEARSTISWAHVEVVVVPIRASSLGCLVIKATRLDAAAIDASGVVGDEDEDEDGSSAAAARIRDKLYLMLLNGK